MPTSPGWKGWFSSAADVIFPQLVLSRPAIAEILISVSPRSGTVGHFYGLQDGSDLSARFMKNKRLKVTMLCIAMVVDGRQEDRNIPYAACSEGTVTIPLSPFGLAC